MTKQASGGFTSVELLITLFIASVFIFAGYQLYSTIVKDASDTRNRAVASNIAYDNLRLIASQAVQPCTAKSSATSTLSPNVSLPPGHPLPPTASIAGTIDCPFGTSDKLSRVSVTVTYGNPQESVTHAIYQ